MPRSRPCSPHCPRLWADFLLWDEDKTNAASLKFWFSVADVDGDGFLRPIEMRYFYEEQSSRLEALRQEAIAFEDVACQMFDLLKPRDPEAIRLRDFLDVRAPPPPPAGSPLNSPQLAFLPARPAPRVRVSL